MQRRTAMPNRLYEEMNTSNNIGSAFDRFMNQYKGQQPNVIINQLVQSGKISQSQLNMVQDKARQMSSMFEGFKRKYQF